MSGRAHVYRVRVAWTGNLGQGTSDYGGYSRAHRVSAAGKPDIEASSDPAFRGDAARWNPEELLVASLSSCHQLWYLHLCADAGIVVVSYEDAAEGVLALEPGGAGRFVRVVLRPHVVIAPGGEATRAGALHARAHAMCFVARSMNFPVTHEPVVKIAR